VVEPMLGHAQYGSAGVAAGVAKSLIPGLLIRPFTGALELVHHWSSCAGRLVAGDVAVGTTTAGGGRGGLRGGMIRRVETMSERAAYQAVLQNIIAGEDEHVLGSATELSTNRFLVLTNTRLLYVRVRRRGQGRVRLLREIRLDELFTISSIPSDPDAFYGVRLGEVNGFLGSAPAAVILGTSGLRGTTFKIPCSSDAVRVTCVTLLLAWVRSDGGDDDDDERRRRASCYT